MQIGQIGQFDVFGDIADGSVKCLRNLAQHRLNNAIFKMSHIISTPKMANNAICDVRKSCMGSVYSSIHSSVVW